MAATRAKKRLHLLAHVQVDEDSQQIKQPPADSLLASLWPAVKEELLGQIEEIRVGDPLDFRNFMCAVIDAGAFADIILLDAEAINVAPLNNVPGAVVTLMERTNVDTVMVAGEVKKWKGQLLGFDVNRLRTELENSRDYLFEAAGIERDLFA